MNDETKQEIEDLSILACSTDEVLRKRALAALLGRVVGRAGNVHWMDEVARLERERDAAKEEARDYDALIGRMWDAIPGYVSTPDKTHGLVEAVTALAQSRDTHKSNVETLARDLVKVQAELAKTTEERDAALERNKAARVLTKPEKSALILGLVGASTYADALRWLEREGYLSVRLPPEE